MSKRILMTVTPDIATKLLAKNHSNRKVRKSHVDFLAEEMRTGQWIDDHHQGIAVNANGDIVDGQHRLIAVIQSGKTVKMQCTFYSNNVTSMDFPCDIQLSRTASDNTGLPLFIVQQANTYLSVKGKNGPRKNTYAEIRKVVNHFGPWAGIGKRKSIDCAAFRTAFWISGKQNAYNDWIHGKNLSPSLFSLREQYLNSSSKIEGANDMKMRFLRTLYAFERPELTKITKDIDLLKEKTKKYFAC